MSLPAPDFSPADPSAPSDLAPSRLPKLVLVLAITCFAVTAIAAVFASVLVYRRDYTAVPFEHMRVELRDENGISSIVTPAFVLSFEGYSQPSNSRSGGHLVDGRDADKPWRKVRDMETTYDRGVMISYSPRRRMAGFDFQTHHAEYIQHQHKLTVNGHEFSTAAGQVRLLVKPNGDVQPLDDPQKELEHSSPALPP